MTDLDRLKAWMGERGINASALAKALRVTRSGAHMILSGKRHIGDRFKYRFMLAYGHVTADAIFTDAKSESSHPLSDPVAHPEKYAARQAVATAIQSGKMLPAKHYKCHGCDKQAQQYHHESYHPNNHLCVVPLCISCHRRHHTGRTPLTFGVVPTSVGVVRIAIAGLAS